jgi:hypothetical protein
MDLHDEGEKKMRASLATSGSRRFERMEEAPSQRRTEGGDAHR